MRITGSARVAVMLFGLIACVLATCTDTSWREFRVPGADFAVSLPEKPKLAESTTAKDGSVSRTYHLDQGTFVYVVAYVTSPPKSNKAAPLDEWLDGVRDELVARMEATLRGERRLSVGGARGMELVLDVPESDDGDGYTIRGRFYVKHAGTGKDLKDILYQTLVAADPSDEEDASVARFLDSFHFVQG
jgi:hypothetical protein